MFQLHSSAFWNKFQAEQRVGIGEFAAYPLWGAACYNGPMDKESEDNKKYVEIDVDTTLSVFISILARVSIIAVIFLGFVLFKLRDKPSSEVIFGAWGNFVVALLSAFIFVALSYMKHCYRLDEESQTLEFSQRFYGWGFCYPVASYEDVLAVTSGGKRIQTKNRTYFWEYRVYALLASGELIEFSLPFQRSLEATNSKAKFLASAMKAKYVEAPSECYVSVEYDDDKPKLVHSYDERHSYLWWFGVLSIIALIIYHIVLQESR